MRGILGVGIAALVAAAAAFGADEVEWEPVDQFDGHVFPAYIIASSTYKVGDEEADPQILGDQHGLFGAMIKSPRAGATAKVTVRCDRILERSSVTVTLPEAETYYLVRPKIEFKYEALLGIRQQAPLDVAVTLKVDGKDAGRKVQTLTLRSINDCPYAITPPGDEEEEEEEEEESDEEEEAAPEETPGPSPEARKDESVPRLVGKASAKSGPQEDVAEGEEEEEEADSSVPDPTTVDISYTFAAFVNENHPYIEELLKAALETDVIDSFNGYQDGEKGKVLLQVYAIWKVLHDRGVKYSNVLTTPAESDIVSSQHVRFLDESIKAGQANCVDGTVLLASVLRKLGIETYLIIQPDHMYLAFDVDQGDPATTMGLETTEIGDKDPDECKPLRDIDEETRQQLADDLSYQTFCIAVDRGTVTLADDKKKIEEGDPDTVSISISEARHSGVMPIAR